MNVVLLVLRGSRTRMESLEGPSVPIDQKKPHRESPHWAGQRADPAGHPKGKVPVRLIRSTPRG